MKPKVTVIDYGVGNMFSVREAFTQCGADVIFTDSAKDVKSADYLVLPGVGAFRDGIEGLNACDLVDAIHYHAKSGKPMLGICLGMQMLLTYSEEFGNTEGLDLIPGKVLPIPAESKSGTGKHKIPHIGWNELEEAVEQQSLSDKPWKGTLLATTQPNAAMYFVHSYTAWPDDPQHRLADCYYDDARISAVIARDNIMGCQFHPEKSGQAGLNIIQCFLEQ